jgi:5-methylcytosine-specific restriction protein A
MVREILYADPDFIEMNERGKRMYSAGLNNYCRFAAGEGFREVQSRMKVLDVPVAPESMIVIEQSVWKQSGILRAQAIELAGYACEINPSHQSFISEKTNKPYMEGYHAMPMNHQNHFPVSLDVYANIVCLCPVCHRKIHYGLHTDRADMVKQIYDARISRLVNSGIEMSKDEFVEAVVGL